MRTDWMDDPRVVALVGHGWQGWANCLGSRSSGPWLVGRTTIRYAEQNGGNGDHLCALEVWHDQTQTGIADTIVAMAAAVALLREVPHVE